MRNYLRYLGYVWHYKARVIIAIMASFGAESLNFASVLAYAAAHDILLNFYLSGGKDPGPMASERIFKGELGQRIIEYLRTRSSPANVLMWTIISLGLSFVVVVAIRGVMIFLRRYLLESAGQCGWVNLLNDLFARLTKQSMRFFSQRSLGHTMSTFGPDIAELRNSGRVIFAHAIRDPFRLLIGLGITFWISVRLSLIVFVAVPITLYIFKIVGDRIRRYTTKGLEKRADAMRIIGETIQAATIIKAYDAEEYQVGRFRENSLRMLRYYLRRTLVKALSIPVTELIYRICLFAVGAYGVYLVIQHSLPVSMLAGFFFAVKQVYEPLEKLRDLNNDIQRSRAAADRVFALMDLQPEIQEHPKATPLPRHAESIRFDHVSFAYEPPHDVVTDIDLTIPAGDVLALVGENGSGKTTLLNLLLRFYDPTEGAVLIDGHDIRTVTHTSLRRQIGYASQNVILFNDTVRHNIAFGDTTYSDAEIEAASRAALAHDFITGSLPNGYDTLVGEGGAKLSGGQRQRIALARALLRDPRILILDEATSAMDVDAEERLQDGLRSFAKGRTVFLIAHRFSTLRLADRIVALANGRIERVGTHDELLATSATYRNLYQKQDIGEGGKPRT